MHSNLSGPTEQSVIEVFAIRGVYYKRFRCIPYSRNFCGAKLSQIVLFCKI